MKRLIFLLIPLILAGIIVAAIINLIILKDNGKGALQVTSMPFSKVYLNNDYIGNTPLCKCEAGAMIPSGEYSLRLVPISGGFREYEDRVTITKGVLTVVDRKFNKGSASEGSVISLKPLSDTKASQLLLISFPDQADVYLDAVNIGKTPFSTKNLTDSDHTLRIKKDGYKDKALRIHTTAGYKLEAIIYLGIQDDSGIPNSITTTPSASITASPSAALSPDKKSKIIVLDTPNGFLRVRQEPSLNALEISRVSPGDTLDLVGESTGWYKIVLPDGTTGWISSQFAKKQ